jgi:hypothetical protein
MSSGPDPIQATAERLAAEAATALLDLNYGKGMSDGSLLSFELLLGENKREALAPEAFEQMKFGGELGEDLREWLEAAHERAMAHRAALGQHMQALEERMNS